MDEIKLMGFKAARQAVAKAAKSLKKKSDIVILLDAGHGGMINGRYATPGKRAYFKDKKLMDTKKLGVDYCEENADIKFYEGVNNRLIRELIAENLINSGIQYRYINSGEEDMKLETRVKIANQYCKEFGTENCIYLSIHSNGFSKESAHGISFYTSIGQTGSDPLAELCYLEAMEFWPDEKFRTDKDDKDLDKEANFYVLKHTRCRAVLGEAFFHTNYRECTKYLNSVEGRQDIADMYSYAIEKMLENEED